MARKRGKHETIFSAVALGRKIPTVGSLANSNAFPYFDCGAYTDSLTLAVSDSNALPKKLDRKIDVEIPRLQGEQDCKDE